MARMAIIVFGEKVPGAVPTRIAVGVSDVIPFRQVAHEAKKLLAVYPIIDRVHRVARILTIFQSCSDVVLPE